MQKEARGTALSPPKESIFIVLVIKVYPDILLCAAEILIIGVNEL